ncbi:MAG TPA: hypothetical protein VGG39_30405 [Polyangiaceae bacterium]
MRLAVLLGVELLLSACGWASPSANGTVSVQGNPTLGTWTQSVDGCEKVNGITLLNHGTAVIAVSTDPVAGNSIELPNPSGGAPFQLFAQQCQTLEVDAHYNGTIVTDYDKNEINDQEIDGSVSAVCVLPNGGTVTANATFSSCL